MLAAGCGKEPVAAPPPADTSLPPVAPVAGMPAPTVKGSTVPAAAFTTADLDAVTRATSPYKVVLIVKTRNNPFFTPMIQAFTAETKAEGAVGRTEAPQQETDKDQQFNLVTTVASEGVQAILIAPADSKAIVPALKQAQAHGALIVNIDNRVDRAEASAQGVQVAGFVGADNEQGGRLAGQAMSKRLGGKGAVAIIEGIRGADNAEARKRGFTAGAEGLTVVTAETANWDTDQAYAKTANVLAAHPDLSGVFCANDKMAIGAIKAIKQQGKTGKIVVVGYDNIPDVKPYLDDGELYATIEQHPDLMGKYGAKMAAGILDGKLPKGRELLVPLEVVKGRGQERQ
jgi:ribose transport system substrate-binding protein